jgi:hypothetical protein
MAATFCPDCTLCPRLNRFLVSTAHKFPDYHCKPVAPFGEASPKLLIVGLAPPGLPLSSAPADGSSVATDGTYVYFLVANGGTALYRAPVATGMMEAAIGTLPPRRGGILAVNSTSIFVYGIFPDAPAGGTSVFKIPSVTGGVPELVAIIQPLIPGALPEGGILADDQFFYFTVNDFEGPGLPSTVSSSRTL